METKNSSIEESSQEDSDILANAKGYFNKYFNQLNEWNDFKKSDFNKRIIKMIFIQQLPFLYNFFRNNYTDDKGILILSDLLLQKYNYYKDKFIAKKFNINCLKFKIGMNIWRLIINQNDEPLLNELQDQLNVLKEEEEIEFISEYLCKIPLLYIIKDTLLSLLKRIEIPKAERDRIKQLITNEYEDTTTIKKRKISQIIPNREKNQIRSQNNLNDMKKPKLSTGINARLSFSQPFTFVTNTMNYQEKKKKENKVSIIDRFFEKCIEKSKMKVPIEKPLHKETTKSKIRRIIGNNFYGDDENKRSKYLPGKKEEETIENKYNILNNKKKKKKMKKSSSEKEVILAYKTPRTVDVIEDAIEKSRNQKITTSAAKRLFYNLLKQNNK